MKKLTTEQREYLEDFLRVMPPDIQRISIDGNVYPIKIITDIIVKYLQEGEYGDTNGSWLNDLAKYYKEWQNIK